MRVSCPSVGLPASTRSPACLPAKAASCIPSVLQPASSQTKTSLDIHRLNAIKAIAVVSSPRRTRRAYPARTDFTARSQLVFLKSQRLACLRLASRLKGPIVTVGEMPPPHNHPLAAACYYDQPDVVKALLASEGDYAEHATREIQRRADGGSTAESNIKDALREWPHDRLLLSCLALCGDAWEAGADILRAREPMDSDPPSVGVFLASRAAT